MTTRREFLKTAAAVPMAGAFDLGIAGAAAASMMALALPAPIAGMQFRDEPVSYWLDHWQHPTQTTFFNLFDAGRILAGVGPSTMPALIEGLTDPRRNRHARGALWGAGDAAVPALLEALASKSRETRESVARILRETIAEIPQEPLLTALRDPSPTVRVGAAEALLNTGVAPKRVIPVLLGVLDQGNEHDRSNAIHAAANARSDEMSVVFEAALTHRDPSVRAMAAKSLLELSRIRQDLIPLLVKMVETYPTCYGGHFARNMAGIALAENEPVGRAALMKLLDHDDASIVCVALDQLAARGKEIPALDRCLNHPEAEVRRRAAWAFKRGRSDRLGAAQLLIKTLNDADSSVRKAAVESLRNIDPPAEIVSLPLSRLLDDAVQNVRVEAAVALAQFGSRDQKVVEVLLAALPLLMGAISRTEFSKVTNALGQCHVEFEQVAPILFTALDAGVDSGIRLSALEALHDLGLPDEQAVFIAAGMMEDDTNTTADCAAYLLTEFGNAGLSRLIEASRHRSKHVRTRVMHAIGRLRRKDESYVHIVARAMTDESALVREAAAHTLSEMAFRRAGARLRIGDSLRTCVPLLTDSLADRDIAVRSAAACALRRFGSAAESAVPSLEKARNDPARIVRSKAEEALVEIRRTP
jgi:HEAT repeat protein